MAPSRTGSVGGSVKKQKTPKMANRSRRSNRMKSSWFIAVIIAALIGLAAWATWLPGQTSAREIGYTQLIEAIEEDRVASLAIEPGASVRGRFAEDAGGGEFRVNYPVPDAGPLAERAAGAGIAVEFTGPGAETQRRMAGITLQILLFAGLGYVLFLQLRGQGMSGKVGSRGDADSTTTFADVAGTQGAAEDLCEVVDFLRDPTAFAAMGARVPKGVLLVGPPGTGKTLLARAVAGEAGVPFFHLSGSEVTGFVVGLGAHRLRSLFARARRRGGVIFIDELDALGGARGSNRSHNEDDRTLNQLLVEMDGFEPTEGVVIVGATNRPEDLDTALKRPGRFDRTVTVGLPTADGRKAILELHATRRQVPIADDVDFARLARLTPGSSGAELANLINEAAIAAVRQRDDIVRWSHFENARDRMLLGKERVGFRAADTEWRIVAVHEAGHAIAGIIACPEDGLHKITIQPRGMAMGVAHFAPDDDRHLHSRRYLEAQIIKGLGGRVAEELVFGAEDVTGGAESDLVHVNRIARRMVYRLGMSSAAGLLVYEDEAPLSAGTQAGMDGEVRELLDRLYSRTRDILAANRPALDALTAALLAHETLDGPEALALLATHGVVPHSYVSAVSGRASGATDGSSELHQA
jgi:cell division protease FtsH